VLKFLKMNQASFELNHRVITAQKSCKSFRYLTFIV
jgi:hypothetical protein